MDFNIPTYLTLLRIGLIPILVLVYYLPWDAAHMTSALIFLAAALTDWLDGYLARRMGLTTKFGAFLDPVADKLMVAVVLVLIVQDQPTIYLAIPAAVIIGREITIASLREWMAELGLRKKVEVSWVGKMKTTAQMVAITSLLLGENVNGIPTQSLGLFLLYVAVILTLWSMTRYIRAALPSMLEHS